MVPYMEGFVSSMNTSRFTERKAAVQLGAAVKSRFERDSAETEVNFHQTSGNSRLSDKPVTTVKTLEITVPVSLIRRYERYVTNY